MIGMLSGKVFEKNDQSVIVDVLGVGYEVFCSTKTVEALGEKDSIVTLHVHSHYNTNGTSLFGFFSKPEKELFLWLIKVDSVGPKSALNILSAAPWMEIVELVEDGNSQALSKLPKISKKTAEHVVVKLKGKLSALALHSESPTDTAPRPPSKSATTRKIRGEAQTALVHLGFKSFEVERVLDELTEDIWTLDLETVIRSALSDLSGNNL